VIVSGPKPNESKVGIVRRLPIAVRLRIVTLLLIACPGHLCSQSPPPDTTAVRKWIEGLDIRRDAFERLSSRLKSFANGPNGSTPGAVPASIGCPVALESALVVALTDAHVTDSGKEYFHLIIHGQREGEVLDLAYSYNQRGTLLLTAILKLPTNWQVGLRPGEANANKFIVVTDGPKGCIFGFDSADPFASKAISKEE
jgi:hypothetical protein